MRKRLFELVGESFANADRTSRQEALKGSFPGDSVRLVREPANPHDKNAILVTTDQGVGLGHIGRDDAQILAEILDSGRQCRARIHELKGGLAGYETLGCRISVAFDDEKFKPHILPKPEQIAFRQKGASSSSGCLSLIAIVLIAPIVSNWLA